MYWTQKLDRLNPRMTRLCARVPGKRKIPLTNRDIAERSGLSLRRVRQLSLLESWAEIKISEMEKFKMGCGIIPGQECLAVAYLARSLDPSRVRGGLFHVRSLCRRSKDPRLKAFFVSLMR